MEHCTSISKNSQYLQTKHNQESFPYPYALYDVIGVPLTMPLLWHMTSLSLPMTHPYDPRELMFPPSLTAISFSSGSVNACHSLMLPTSEYRTPVPVRVPIVRVSLQIPPMSSLAS